MSTTSTVIVAVAAAWVGFSAYAVLTHKSWVVDNPAEHDVPRGWWSGSGSPAVGLAAVIGLVLYFAGAVVTVLHARAHGHVAFPLLYLAPVVAAGVLIAA